MSEKRKKALVVYLAALFGVAFLIVSISLGIEIKKNTLNTTSAEKVVALQNEIQALKNENEELRHFEDDLTENLTEILESLEYLEGNAQESTAKIEAQARLLEIYEYLIQYQDALISEDEESTLMYRFQLVQCTEDAKALDPDLYERIQTIINESETTDE